ncbi:MAG TPA: hypothetical protein VML35_09315 [Gaiellaceae bacterium]|nr:hypothetical protein [Gaiellaceae bacterium]
MRKVLLAIGVGAALALGPAAQADPPGITAGANLLTNAAAEDGAGSTVSAGSIVPVPEWTTTASFTAVEYGTGNFPSLVESTRIGGGTNFFAGGPGGAVSTASQTVDVSAAAAEIDADRADATIAAHIGGFSTQQDRATVAAIYRDDGGAELGRQTIGPVLPVDRDSLTELRPRSATGSVPVGTRAIEVVMTATRSSGTSNDGYLDNLSLSLDYDPLPDRTLTVSVSGTGSVTSVPAGISCGADCTETVADGTSLTLTATPSSDATVGPWTGCNSSAGATCTVTLDADRAVVATFTPVAPPPSPPAPPPPAPTGADLRLGLAPAAADAGAETDVVATVSNDGPIAAAAVRLAGWPPSQVFAAVPSSGSCDLQAGSLACALGDLPAGGSVDVTLRLWSATAGEIPVALAVSSATPDSQPANNVAETVARFLAVPPPPVADLAVEVTGPPSALPSSQIRFDGRVRNDGPAPAPLASLQVLGLNGLRVLTAATPAGTCTVALDAVCALGTLAPGEVVSVAVTARLPSILASSARAALQLVAGGAVVDPVPANDSARTLIGLSAGSAPCLYTNYGGGGLLFQMVRYCSDAGLTTVADMPAALPGDLVTFRSTVEVFTWADVGGGVTLLNELPAGVDFVSASAHGGCTRVERLVTCSLSGLTKAAPTVVVDIAVRVRSAERMVNTTTLSGSLFTRPRVEVVLKPCGVLGTDGPDALRSRFAEDVVCGGGGDDHIVLPFDGVAYGGPGDDVLVGSTGEDSLWGGLGNDQLDGGAGDDQLYGDEGDDVLRTGDGGADGDRAFGGAGADVVEVGVAVGRGEGYGGTGNDRLTGGSRARLFGDAGADLLTALPGAVDVWLDGGPGADRLVGGRWLFGGDGDDTLVGDSSDQYLAGGSGADSIAGGAGQDVIDGGSGDDRIQGGIGADVIDAGPGHDVVDGDDAGRTRVPERASTADTIFGGDGRDILRGGPGPDTIDGGPVDDTIEGGGGSNVLRGGDGSDRITGGPLADLIEGGNGHDRVFGGGGSDHIFGGAGKDELHGEAGLDRIFGGPGRDTIVPGSGADVVDAMDGEVDTIICDASPAPVDGPFLVDRNDSAPRCRSLYTPRVEIFSTGGGFCVYPIAWTSVDLTYRWRNLRGGNVLRGAPGQPQYGQFYWRAAISGATNPLSLNVIAEREGLTLTRTYTNADAPAPNCPPMNSDGSVDPQSDVEEVD